MLKVEQEPDGVLHVLVDGLLTTDDYTRFVPRFEQFARPANRILIELGPNFAGWSFGGLWRDVKFNVDHLRQFDRIAIIGNKRWEKWGTDASALLIPSEMRFFERAAASDAIAWLRRPADETGR